MVILARAALSPSMTASTCASGTMMRRMAVHFCPALVVISRCTSFRKRSNSALPGAASAKSKRSLEFEARMAAERGEKMREEEAAAEEKKTALQKSKEAREAAQKARPIQEAAPRKERAVSSSGGGGGGVGISAKDVLPTFGQDKEDRGPGDASSASYKIASEKRKEQKAAAEKRLKSRKRNQTFIEMSKKQ